MFLSCRPRIWCVSDDSDDSGDSCEVQVAPSCSSMAALRRSALRSRALEPSGRHRWRNKEICPGVSGQGLGGEGLDDHRVLGERFRIVGYGVFLKTLFQSSGAWHHSLGFWPQTLGVGKEGGEFGIRSSPVQPRAAVQMDFGQFVSRYSWSSTKRSSHRSVPTLLEGVFQSMVCR